MSDSLTKPTGRTDVEHEGLALVQRDGLRGMITLRGDLASKPLRVAASGAAGVALPVKNSITGALDGGLCWMSPDELLLLCPRAQTTENVANIQAALGNTHALAVDVSDARAVFRVSGDGAREVLAKLCPVDLSPPAFKPGMLRRTRMAQVPVAFWMSDGATFHVICFRSVADYVLSVLRTAAQPHSGVGYFPRD
jgi:sarcosine oxidase, subunit gamma